MTTTDAALLAASREAVLARFPLSRVSEAFFDDMLGVLPPAHLAGVPGFQLFDSLAVDSAGNVCVATLMNGGITVMSPDGKSVEHVPMPDYMTTNICFGGPDMRTAYVTLSSTGRLVSFEWPRPGLKLNFS